MARIEIEGATRVFRGGRAVALSQARTFEALEQGTGVGDAHSPAAVAPVAEVRALDGIDLTIEDGETVSVIGPSGCGKSTLLKVIAGLESLDAGTVRYDGVDMTDVSPGDRGIGMVFQNYALYPHMEARKNLAFFFWVRKRDIEVNERVRITSEIMGLGFEQLLDRKPKTLSGGQQQRVAIARCIVRDPRLFLFDEPLSNLDAKLRSRTRIEVKRLLSRFRITAVYVTHDQVEALALADRVAVMRSGRIEQIGTYAEIYHGPRNAFVAGFVGALPATFLTGEIADGTVRVASFKIPLSDAARFTVGPRRRVLVGIRPEHLGTDLEDDSAPRGFVEVIEPLVSERAQLLHVRLPTDEALVARIDGGIAVNRGDRVPLAIRPERLMLFDLETEMALT
ncbi:MAG: ABC transporter ATP-binding protein [Chloroflexi bacterium]|nr:ABC transporter ATP-binding protein [Chloroflexota bacterium]